ncbi:iron-containing alcohol dehydrogenase [Cytobacillus purgationiresistens]|uniref:Alcohol dehydrogenase n=1 Tax=Cytobacillus purgationiresistens TaxID=863449 RepID=A0ABU0AD25_9BACI|nr:iron-containing alcohol dehydrogenase [Cytobacillus purgationiresistens]MDQ0269157.1 alcohol dehydrogenase [Cytobacillus purgationiresistens]
MKGIGIFRTPQTIIYGRDSFEKVAEEAESRGSKALIISDKIMNQLGYTERCKDFLTGKSIESELYLGVDSEPTDRYVDEALTLFKSTECDHIISIGGGSCIDTAKAVAVLASNGGDIGNYMGGRKAAVHAPIPHIAIPTTAGTGSEATDVTVITNTANDIKMMIKQPAFMPSVALVDPVLTISSPKHVTAATGIDALSHAVEAYLSKKAHPMTDTVALSAMKLIVENIEAAYEDGSNLDAREAMSLGSMQAGMAFSNASVCLVHGMSRPIGALFHVPHGYSNAMLLPAVLEFSKEACIDRLADLGRIFISDHSDLTNKEAADLAVSAVKKLCLTLNIPNLKGWGIDETAFNQAVNKMTIDAIDSGSPANSPRVPSAEELEALYHTCYHYQFAEKEEVQ